MNNLLLEIGSEEIPAGYISPALKVLSATLLQRLDDARIEHGDAKIYGTPRRLAVIIEDIAPKQKSMKKKSIAAKIAEKTHSSQKEILKDTLPYLQVAFKKNKDFRNDLIKELDLSKEEVEWLRK